MKILILLLLLLIPFVLAEDLDLYTPCGGDLEMQIACFGDAETNQIKEAWQGIGTIELEDKGYSMIFPLFSFLLFISLMFILIKRQKNKKRKVYNIQ